jgi:RNA polymerase sigma-70 factor (ECF subfamily)
MTTNEARTARGVASDATPGEPHNGSSDEEVVTRVMAGDIDLFEILMRRYNQRLYRAVRSIVTDEAEVEDVLQEAYLSAYDHLGGFAGRSSFATWLVRIAVNKALDRLRRSRRLVGLETVDPAHPQEQPGFIAFATNSTNPEQASASRELVDLLSDAIDALPAGYRTVYVLREIEDLNTREVADCLSLEVATVKTRLHRARGLLREGLDRDLGDCARHAFTFGGDRCNRMVSSVLEALFAGRG